MELTDEIIVKICEIGDDFGLQEYEIGMDALDGEDISKKYIDDDILIEYYYGIKWGKTPSQMREICLLKYIRRELSKIYYNQIKRNLTYVRWTL